MKKHIQKIIILAFVFSCTVASAGVSENRVVQLLSQSILNSTVSGSEQISFNATVKNVTMRNGAKPVIENLTFASNLMLTNDVSRNVSKIEGNTKIFMSGISVTVPVNIIAEKDAVYIYMFPIYSQLFGQYAGLSDLSVYDNTWQRIDLSELNSVSTSTAVVTGTRSNLSNVWGDTTWFTAKSTKSAGVTTYNIKANPAVILAKLNKTDATRVKKPADLIDLLKKMTFQVTEKNGKLASYNVGFSLKTTEAGLNVVVNTTGNFTFKGTPQVKQNIVIPANFNILSLKNMQSRQSSPVNTTTSVSLPGSTQGTGFTYTVPAGYMSQTDSEGTLYVWKEDQDIYGGGVVVFRKIDEAAKSDMIKMRSDADANKIFKEWGGNGFQRGYIRVINGQTFYIKEQFLAANINSNGDSNKQNFQLNSLMALTYKGDKVYVIEFTDDYVSYDRNKAFLETFLSGFKLD